MKKVKLTFKIMSYWHAGSGSGEGANLDAVVIKTANGLPYLPGKTVKGLLREAVQTVEDCDRLPKGTTTKMFGKKKDRFDTEESALEFRNATLDPVWEEWAKRNIEDRQMLFEKISSTAIDDEGIAKDKALRSIEVAVPLSLTALIESKVITDETWITALEMARPFVRHIGSHRHRGLGRTELSVTVEEAKE